MKEKEVIGFCTYCVTGTVTLPYMKKDATGTVTFAFIKIHLP
jgi:hypothetical protein